MDKPKSLLCLERIPHLKLPPKHLCCVLQAIKEAQPERASVQGKVMKHFPGKAVKSVFRGMVQPATVRLDFARAEGDSFYLAPNGRLVTSLADQERHCIRRCLEDFALLRLGLWRAAFDILRPGIREQHTSVYERATRFWNYVAYFSIRLPPADMDSVRDKVSFLYEKEAFALYAAREKRRDLLASALTLNRLFQMDEARWRVIHRLLENKGIIATSYFVDEILWKEGLAGDPIIELWEGAVPAQKRLARGGRAFEAVIRRR